MSNGKLSNNAITIAENRYFMEDEDWESMSRRVGFVIAGPENSQTGIYADKFAEMIFNLDFLPGGRILRNAGRQAGSLFNCISGETELISTNGFIKVKDLKIGDRILNGDGEFACVKNVQITGHRNKLKRVYIKKFGKHIYNDLTVDHKILIYNNIDGIGWKSVGDVDIKTDRVVLPNIQQKDEITTIIINDILNIGEIYNKKYEIIDNTIYILNGSNKSKHRHDQHISEIKNEIKINGDFCKLVGFYLSKGTCKSENNSVIFSFNAAEVEYINETIKLLYDFFGIHAVTRENTGHSIQVVVNSRILNAFFSTLFGDFSYQKKLPWWWLSLDDALLFTTLKYYLKGDGYLTTTHHNYVYTAASVSKLLVYQLFLLANKLKLSPSFLKKNPKKKTGSIKNIDYVSPAYRIYFSFSSCANNLSLFDDSLSDFNINVYSIDKIIDVDYNDVVWDIEMDGTPSFVTTNMVCHNCYHLPIGDSREEIGTYYKDSLILWGEGGGVGVNMSSLRPKGAPIKKVGGNSSGPVSFLEASDSIAATIESGGSRRAAALALMNVSHPDILDFIDAKLVHGKLSHYNISVAITHDFLEAVESDDDWEFKFSQKSYGNIKARTIWAKIVENMVKCAEPGLLNWNNLTKNNSYYYDPVMGCNPCGEAILSPYDVCDLGSLVLPNFITGTVYTNWKKLEETIKIAIRFLDDVIDVNKYVLKEIDIKAHNSRRVGMGVMGLAEYLFAKKLRYGSEKAIAEIEKLMRFIRDTVYQTLVELAVEKGAFPKFEPVAYGKASFIRKLPASLRMDVKKYGVRCVTGLAIAPTGTISLLADVTSGIEPLFRKAYLRHDRVSDRIYVHPLYKDLLNRNEKIPDWYVDTDDLHPTDHLETQAIIQKYIDGAVSKTINLPSTTTPEELSDYTLEYIYDLKGVTVYVDGSRKGQILNPVTQEEVKKYLKEDKINNSADIESVECATGSCEL